MWPLILTHTRCHCFNSFRRFPFNFFLSESVRCFYFLSIFDLPFVLSKSGTCNGLERRYSEGRRVYNTQCLRAIDNNGDGVKWWPWRYHFHGKYNIRAVCRFSQYSEWISAMCMSLCKSECVCFRWVFFLFRFCQWYMNLLCVFMYYA